MIAADDADEVRPVDHATIPQPLHSVIANTAAMGTRVMQPQPIAADSQSTRVVGRAPSQLAEAGLVASMPERLGGYKIEKPLGQGGMGAVFLARQLSLNRPVALKTIHPRIAENPVALARFTREAHAAAQLMHHHIVQIFDMGEDRGTHFFSMEFIDGQNLADLVARQGRVEPREAAGLMIQAARGLEFVHQQGMIHRDVKPANLLLNQQGMVKVADLGLVKVRNRAEERAEACARVFGAGAAVDDGNPELTTARALMGTAAYIAPEQSYDAGNVDQRADIYSLGCSFWVLLTGKAPFEGATATELIEKHRNQPLPRVDKTVPGVPRSLADVVERMTAKRPEDRYPALDAVIQELEVFLNRSTGTLGDPGEHDALSLGDAADQYRNALTVKLRPLLSVAFFAICLLSVAGAAWAGRWTLALIAGLVAVIAPVAQVLLSGAMEDSFFFARLRAAALDVSVVDWLLRLATVGVGVAAVTLVGLPGPLIAATVIGIALAAAVYFVVDRRLTIGRRAAAARARAVLSQLRARGMDEEELQNWAMEELAPDGEAIYEELFGYEAVTAARERMTRKGRRWRRHARWRDPLLRAIAEHLDARRQARERRHLRRVEERRLRAEGATALAARQKASATARTMAEQAAEIRQLMAQQRADRAEFRKFLMMARTGMVRTGDRSIKRLLGRWMNRLFGSRARLLAGVGLIAMCFAWMYQNLLIAGLPGSCPLGAGLYEFVKVEGSGTHLRAWRFVMPDASWQTAPLVLGNLPPVLTEWCNGYEVGVAGLLLAITGILVPGWRIALFVVPAAVLAILGAQVPLPSYLPLVLDHDVTYLAAAVLLTAIGFVVSRRR